MTDLTRTQLGQVRNRFFRMFTPVKIERMRLPTAIPEFRHLKHYANLSDSPVTAAARLGGHWSQYNVAAITQVAACNFRCTYCYVEFAHLAGKDSFVTTAKDIVSEFRQLKLNYAEVQPSLSMLRISGGEPLLAPNLIGQVWQEMERQKLSSDTILKVESNISALPYSWAHLTEDERNLFRGAAANIALHVTIHDKPPGRLWPFIASGLHLAYSLGMDLYPAIGGADWSSIDMEALLSELRNIDACLPLRLAVRPFRLDYTALANRQNLPQASQSQAPSTVWESLLKKHYGIPYLDNPRHTVSLTR